MPRMSGLWHSKSRPCRHCGGKGVVTKVVKIQEDYATMMASVGGIMMTPMPKIEHIKTAEVPCPHCRVTK